MRCPKNVIIVLCLFSLSAWTSAFNNSSYRVKRHATRPVNVGVQPVVVRQPGNVNRGVQPAGVRQPVYVQRPIVPVNNAWSRQPVVVRQPNGMVYYPANTNYYIPNQGGYTNRPVLVPTRLTVDTTNVVTPQPNPLTVTIPCEVSITETSNTGFICKGQLLFEDNFNANLDDDKIWTSEIYMPDQPDYPFNVYEKKAYVEDGKLVIRPVTLESVHGIDFVRKTLDLRDRCTTTSASVDECYREAFGPQILPPAITAKITTKRTFSFKYGRIEVGAKMPAGDWLIPLIQLEPRDNVYGSLNYESGLIRIACVKGNIEYSKILHGGAILSESVPFRNANLIEKTSNDQWNKNYHNYTVVWNQHGISMYVDGEKYGEVSPRHGFFEEAKRYNMSPPTNWLQGTGMAPLDQMFYVSIGLDVGGIHEFPDSPKKPWTNASNKAMLEFWNSREKWYPTWRKDTSALSIDYVRIYSL